MNVTDHIRMAPATATGVRNALPTDTATAAYDFALALLRFAFFPPFPFLPDLLFLRFLLVPDEKNTITGAPAATPRLVAGSTGAAAGALVCRGCDGGGGRGGSPDRLRCAL